MERKGQFIKVFVSIINSNNVNKTLEGLKKAIENAPTEEIKSDIMINNILEWPHKKILKAILVLQKFMKIYIQTHNKQDFQVIIEAILLVLITLQLVQNNKMKCHYCGKEETLFECNECHSKFLVKDETIYLNKIKIK